MARIKAKTLMSRSTLMRPPSTGQASASQGETSPQPPPQPVFSQRPFNTFSVPTAVMAGQQPFPYYPPGTILQATWIEPRQQFFPPEVGYHSAVLLCLYLCLPLVTAFAFLVSTLIFSSLFWPPCCTQVMQLLVTTCHSCIL